MVTHLDRNVREQWRHHDNARLCEELMMNGADNRLDGSVHEGDDEETGQSFEMVICCGA